MHSILLLVDERVGNFSGEGNTTSLLFAVVSEFTRNGDNKPKIEKEKAQKTVHERIDECRWSCMIPPFEPTNKKQKRPNRMPHLPKSILLLFPIVILLFSCFLSLLPRFKCQTYEIDTVQPWMYDGEGGLASHVRLNLPSGVAFHPITGDLFIADSENNIIRTINHTTGVITTVAGIPGKWGFYGDGELATRAQLNMPRSIAFSPDGTVMYIADQYNNRVRMVKDGIITTVAGNGTNGFTGDGVPANSTSLY